MNLEDYKIIEKRDCNTGEVLGLIALNKKHTIEEFQKEIYRAKKEASEEIEMFGDDWYYITAHMKKNFDFIELDYDEYNDYIEY